MKNENDKILMNFKLPKKDNEICGPYIRIRNFLLKIN